MHSAALLTWLVLCQCTKTYEGRGWSSPWQSWMVAQLANPDKRCTASLRANIRVLPVSLSLTFGSFLSLCLLDFGCKRACFNFCSCCAPIFQTAAHLASDLWAKTGPRRNQCPHSQSGVGLEFCMFSKKFSQILFVALLINSTLNLQHLWNWYDFFQRGSYCCDIGILDQKSEDRAGCGAKQPDDDVRHDESAGSRDSKTSRHGAPGGNKKKYLFWLFQSALRENHSQLDCCP